MAKKSKSKSNDSVQAETAGLDVREQEQAINKAASEKENQPDNTPNMQAVSDKPGPDAVNNHEIKDLATSTQADNSKKKNAGRPRLDGERKEHFTLSITSTLLSRIKKAVAFINFKSNGNETASGLINELIDKGLKEIERDYINYLK